ncbi:hypothetical protein ACFQ71_12280 [Streptomyces sp. NPDC056534]|uniref:hypothetical protein n=1 Tax=Streptomyces sp. NPDC056534 TaxID=3345857 RepID=UPI0036809B0A
MDHLHPARVVPTGTTTVPPPRRLVAVGIIRRHGGRTITVRATEAGATGTITPRGGAR